MFLGQTCVLDNLFEKPAWKLVRVHRYQGRLVCFEIVQGDMTAFLADDVKSAFSIARTNSLAVAPFSRANID